MQCYNLTKLLHEQAVIKRRADGWRIGLRQLTKKIIAKIKEGYLQELYKETAWMYQYARRYWLSICFYIVAGVFGTLMGLGSSVLSKYLIDAVTGVKKERIVIFAVLIVCMTIANILINAIISRISARINVVIQNEIQADIFGKILHTEWKELQQFRSGDLLNRLSNDAVQVASSVISWIPNSITKLVQFIGAFVIIFYYDPVMAGIALLSAPVTILFSRRMMQKMRIYNKEMREMTSGLMAFQDDTFQNIQTVKALNLTSVFEKKLQGLQNKYKEKMLDYNRFTVYTSSFMSAVGTGASYICFGWSVYRLWSGYITTGTLLMFFQMANSLSSSFSALIQIVPSAINAATCAGRLMAVSELEKEKILDKEQMAAIRKKVKTEITIEMKNITISYRDTRKVIDNGNFMAKPGEITAVIGPSGEGKTTLLRILLGLLYPINGTAELKDSEDTRCRISSVTRELFSYVPQGNTVFAGTIAENMRMVKESATEEEIRDALETACAYEFVKELPEGIETTIGEKGGGLSEGQAQRIAIARALLKNAPVLILDEATSALDMDTEEQVLRNIMKRDSGRTCIVTTHRPSVLSVSNHIYEIRERNLKQLK